MQIPLTRSGQTAVRKEQLYLDSLMIIKRQFWVSFHSQLDLKLLYYHLDTLLMPNHILLLGLLFRG